MLIYIVVIACITCCGAVYNLCLVLMLYMFLAFNNNLSLTSKSTLIMLKYYIAADAGENDDQIISTIK